MLQHSLLWRHLKPGLLGQPCLTFLSLIINIKKKIMCIHVCVELCANEGSCLQSAEHHWIPHSGSCEPSHMGAGNQTQVFYRHSIYTISAALILSPFTVFILFMVSPNQHLTVYLSFLLECSLQWGKDFIFYLIVCSQNLVYSKHLPLQYLNLK